MGWDAFSSEFYNNKKYFKKASNDVRNICNSVDGGLELGGLDCSACAKMLERATNEDSYSYDGWNAKKVKQLQKLAFWEFPYLKTEKWAFLSAKYFLKICAENNLSISFSW